MKPNNFQCLGKTSRGERCRKTFITTNWSKTLTCTTHRNQIVNFQYSNLKTPCNLHDVAGLIANLICDPKTFATFAKICLSTAKACSALQTVKKAHFRIKKKMNGIEGTELPNGSDWMPTNI